MKRQIIFILLIILIALIIISIAKIILAEESKPQVEITSGIALDFGNQTLDTKEKHNILIFPGHIGYIFPKEIAKDHWYRGYFEGGVQLFTGHQYAPNGANVDGGALFGRYLFGEGSFKPFVELDLGLVDTNIGLPDLGGHTNFDLEGYVGFHQFLDAKETIAITFKAGWQHFSSAGIHTPNRGVNMNPIFLGVTQRFNL